MNLSLTRERPLAFSHSLSFLFLSFSRSANALFFGFAELLLSFPLLHLPCDWVDLRLRCWAWNIIKPFFARRSICACFSSSFRCFSLKFAKRSVSNLISSPTKTLCFSPGSGYRKVIVEGAFLAASLAFLFFCLSNAPLLSILELTLEATAFTDSGRSPFSIWATFSYSPYIAASWNRIVFSFSLSLSSRISFSFIILRRSLFSLLIWSSSFRLFFGVLCLALLVEMEGGGKTFSLERSLDIWGCSIGFGGLSFEEALWTVGFLFDEGWVLFFLLLIPSSGRMISTDELSFRGYKNLCSINLRITRLYNIFSISHSYIIYELFIHFCHFLNLHI